MHHRRCVDHDDDIFSIYKHMCEIEMANKTALLPGDSEIDQIHKIFRLFGTPSESQWTELCLLPFWRNNFPQWEPLAWNIIVPRLSRDATDLLSVRHHYHYDHDRYPEVDHLYNMSIMPFNIIVIMLIVIVSTIFMLIVIFMFIAIVLIIIIVVVNIILTTIIVWTSH